MSSFTRYAEILGVHDLSALALYGALSLIVLASIVVGLAAQVWKGRTGGLWAIIALAIQIGAWFAARHGLDPSVYAASWGGDQGWGALALGIAVGGLAVSFAILSVMPGRRRKAKRIAPSPGEEAKPNILGEPWTPIVPLEPRRGIQRRLFVPAVILGIVLFIGAGIMSVEKRQLDIFLRSVGIIKAEPQKTAAQKRKARAAKARTAKTPKAAARDPMVAQAQQFLLDLGYDAGAADGRIGGKTDEALRKFQGWEGLPRNGKVSAKLIERLKMVKQANASMTGATRLTDDFQPHADMCQRGVHAWYRSRTTKLSVDGTTQSISKLVAEVTVWFSYPGGDLQRVRGTAICKYTRHRGEMPEQAMIVDILSGDVKEQLTDRELACFSEGQPC